MLWNPTIDKWLKAKYDAYIKKWEANIPAKDETLVALLDGTSEDM